MRIVFAEEAFNRKTSPLTSNLNNEFRNILVRCYVWSIVLYGSVTWTVRKMEQKCLESCEMWCWRRMKKIKWSEKATNEQVLERIGEKRILLNSILHRNCLLHDEVEGQMTKSEMSKKKKILAP